MRIYTFVSDMGGPYRLRVEQPMRALKRFGVVHDFGAVIPSEPNTPGPSLNALINLLSSYDMCILQRVTSLPITQMVKNACHFLDIPLVKEVDDNYIHLPKNNPCHYSTAIDNPLLEQIRLLSSQGNEAAVNELMPHLEHSRLVGLEQYKVAMGMYDAVTVTTEELAQVIRPYNKNIEVFPNQMERVHYFRDYTFEETDANGRMKPPSDKLGMHSIPAFWYQRDAEGRVLAEQPANRIVRIGYTGTSSHGDDFRTIEDSWVKLTKNYADKCWFTYIGDPYFFDKQLDHRSRRQFIPPTESYEKYISNVRNLDIGIAPLDVREPFNMSKSDLKALEYASWGIPAVLPAFITYSRSFTHNVNCLMYNNKKEFYTCLETYINDPALRIKHGNAAREMVAGNPEAGILGRLEDHHSERRYNFYAGVINSKKKSPRFTPNKETAVV